jgi:hypothetical protein
MTSLRKNFKNNIKNELKNILKYNCRCVLIANTFINSNRSLDGNYPDCQQTANFKDRAFRISKDLIIAD